MATYYKYAERNIDSQINWSEVGKNVVDMLREEDRLREEKKDAIDKASREFGETLSNAPTGDFKSANEWILGYASDASQARLMQDRLLKSGLLKIKDYTVARQNLNDGTNQMFQVAKEYQDKASEAMKRYQAGESQDTEAWLMEQVEGLSNFKNTKAYINPTNYTVSLAGMTKKVVDGKEVMVMEQNPDKYLTVNQLRNRMNVKLDRFDYVASVDREVSALGEFQTASIAKVAGLYKMANVTEILDPTNRTRLSDEDNKTITAYQEWEKNSINAQLSNSYNQLSILTDAIDKVPGTKDFYEPTFDPELAKTNDKYILLEDDGSGMPKPVFTEKQTKAATEFLRAQTRNALDRKTSTTTTQEQQAQPVQQWQAETSNKKKQDANAGNIIGQIFSGTENEIAAAISWILASEDVSRAVRTNKEFQITKKGVTKSFDMTNYDDFVAAVGRFLDPNLDMDAVRRGSERGSGGKNKTTISKKEISSESQQMNIDAEFQGYVGELFDTATIAGFKDDEDAAVDYFRNKIATIPGLTGYTVEGDGSVDPTSDGIIIKDANGKLAYEFTLNGINTDKALKAIQGIQSVASAKATAEEKLPVAQKRYKPKQKGELDQ